jgi:two-component system chemotaxis sensor kinase CheA
MFEQARFERSGEQKVVRYRESLLPVFSLPEFLHLPFEDSNLAAKEGIPVVVIKRGDRSYGIEVRDIQDIVELSARIDQSIKDRPGILGTIVAQEKVIVVVDMFGMIDQVRTRLEIGSQAPGEAAKVQKTSNEVAFRRNHSILVVEDSAFFRGYTRQILEEAGYVVEVAEDGAEGLAIFEGAAPTHFSLILSDIEMPQMDGLELARRVRASKGNSKIPMVAITTRFSASDVANGEKAGFSKYLEKLDPDKLIKQLDDMLGRQEGGAKRAANS